MKSLSFAFAACVALIAGCASAPVPTERLVASRSVVHAAETSGETSPRASQHIALAREELALGEELIKNGNNRDAALALARAQADAELAIVLAREAVAQRAVEKAIDQARVLREHIH
jgi:hypothetical protein